MTQNLDGLNMKEESTAIGNLNIEESEDRNEIDPKWQFVLRKRTIL